MISRFFKSFWNFLKTPWVLALGITILLILLVWFLGPYIAIADNKFLSGVIARLVATVILMFSWGLFVALYYGRRRKKELADPEKAQKHEKERINKHHFREEFDYIKDTFKSALKVVTKSNFYGTKSRSRYALPWYMLLGSSNSGKTSVLLNSGLKFPLNEQADRHLYQLKGTERCEVFFGNEAVFIDTPGEYTESPVDSSGHRLWMYFLRRLFKVRPARPLNGIIMCVSMREIMDADSAKREHLGITIRTRLNEVLKNLHSYVPIYLVVTKCDAVPGFTEFFAHLSRSEREQIFGCLSAGDSMMPGSVHTELKDLLQTLNAQIISKMHQERDVPSRGDMFVFPQEFDHIGQKLEDFIAEAFGHSRYYRPVMFRGFFFTCALANKDALASAAEGGEATFQTGFHASVAKNYHKGFFLFNLIQNCIIPEAKLAGEDKEHVWGLRLRRYGMQIAACAILLIAGSALGISFTNNYSNVDKLDAVYTAFASEQKKIPQVNDSKEVFPELAKIEQATYIFDPDEDSFFGYGLGLYQGNTFDKATNSAYLGTLNSRFMPALRTMAIQKMDKSLSSTSELKSALRAYLMLCQPEHINEKFLRSWLDKQWSERYLGRADVQDTMRHHMDYLLARGIVPVEPDQDAVERARKALLKVPLAELAYQRMQEEAIESGQQPFTFRSAIGESPFDGDSYEIPGLYTRDGYAEYLIKRCPGIIRSLTDESWIFGNNPIALSVLDVNKVHKDVRVMYFKDYIQYWSKAVQELKVRTPGSLPDAQKLAEQMTGGVSPTVLVLREIRTNTTFVLEQTEPDELEKALTAEAQKKIQQNISRKTGSKVASALTAKGAESLEEIKARAAEEAWRDAQAVRQYFLPLDNLLDADGNPKTELKAADDAMGNTRDYFSKLNSSDNIERSVLSALLEIADEKDNTLRTLDRAAEKLPSPVRSWYSTTSSGGLRKMLAIGATSIDRAYHEKVLSEYNKKLRTYYPFNQASDNDVNLDDFSAFFRSGGTLDSFHDAYLSPFITRNGQLRSIMGHTLPVSSQAVLQLQRANRVQDAFFMSGRDLGISFLMEPHALDATLKQVVLSNSGKLISYWHGPVTGASFVWPGENGQSAQAYLETTDLSGITTKHNARGDWALFRLLKGATIKRQDGNVCLLEVQNNGKWVQFLIQFRNRSNPFDPAVCSFALPESLQ